MTRRNWGALVFVSLLGCSGGAGEEPSGNPGEFGDGGAEGGTAGNAGSTGGTGSTASVGGTGAGTAGTGGTPNECEPSTEQPCGCPDGAVGQRRCLQAAVWGECQCQGGEPGAGGEGGSVAWLGRTCTYGTDECQIGAPDSVNPICVQADGMAGGEPGRPGYCSYACKPVSNEADACTGLGGTCTTVGALVSHCVGP